MQIKPLGEAGLEYMRREKAGDFWVGKGSGGVNEK